MEYPTFDDLSQILMAKGIAEQIQPLLQNLSLAHILDILNVEDHQKMTYKDWQIHIKRFLKGFRK